MIIIDPNPDLPDHVKSEIRLFADDCLIYRRIYLLTDLIAMQQDLCSIGEWARYWGMKLNEKKCYIFSTLKDSDLSFTS